MFSKKKNVDRSEDCVVRKEKIIGLEIFLQNFNDDQS